MRDEKKEVGHQHECPGHMTQETSIGGYVFASSIDGVFVYGSKGYNLTTAPITKISMIPLNKERIDAIASDEDQIGDAFYIEDNTIYYYVGVGEYSYIFKKLNDALSFTGTIIEYKASGLTDGFLRKRLENEV